MTDDFLEIRQHVIEAAEQELKEHKDELLLTFLTICIMELIEEEEGTLALEDYLKSIERMNPPCFKLLKVITLLTVDGTDEPLVFEVITNSIYKNINDGLAVFVSYLYLLCMKDIKEIFNSDRASWDDTLTPEKKIECLKLKKPLYERLNNILDDLFPEQYHDEFRRVISNTLKGKN